MLLLLLRRSLLSPLFPYTTLFRSVDPYLPGRGADRGDMDSLRHPVGMLSRAADAIAVARVQRRASAGQRSDDLQDQPDPRPVERELGEPLVDVVRQTDLGELDLSAALQLAPLEDAGHLRSDGAQEVDITRVELTPLRALHVQHPDQPRS